MQSCTIWEAADQLRSIEAQKTSPTLERGLKLITLIAGLEPTSEVPWGAKYPLKAASYITCSANLNITRTAPMGS